MVTFDDRPLWTEDDLERWARSPNVLVRVWTCWRLTERPPSPRVARLLTGLLEDADPQVQRHAAEALAYQESPEAVLPLLRYARRAGVGPALGFAALALARRGDRRFSPTAVRALERTLRRPGPGPDRGDGSSDAETALLLVRALERAATRTALATLRRMARAPLPEPLESEVALALVRRGTASDVREVVQWYRRRARGPLDPVFLAVADGFGLTGRLVALAESFARAGWAGVAEEVRQAAGGALAVWLVPDRAARSGPSPTALRDLDAAARARFSALASGGTSPFLPCIRRLTWLLRALGEPGPHPAPGADEVLLALAGAEMLERYGEAHRLALRAPGSAPGRPGPGDGAVPGLDALLEAWALEVPFMPPGWEAALLGNPDVAAPELGRILATRPDGWAGRRAARLLRRLSHADPGAARAALENLLRALPAAGRNRADVVRALAAQGAAALPAIAAALPGSGDVQEALLTALSLIPAHGSAALIRQHWPSFVRLGSARVADAALTLGARDLLPFLRRLWQPGQPEVASAILILAALHGVTLDPSEWPVLVQDVLAAREALPGLPEPPPDSVHECRVPYGRQQTCG